MTRLNFYITYVIQLKADEPCLITDLASGIGVRNGLSSFLGLSRCFFIPATSLRVCQLYCPELDTTTSAITALGEGGLSVLERTPDRKRGPPNNSNS